MTDNKNIGGLGPAKRPSHETCRDNKPHNNGPLSTYNNGAVSNNICPICGGDHNVLVIGLENGSHIITRPFPNEKATKVNVTDGKRRATRLDLVDVFWRPDEDRV